MSSEGAADNKALAGFGLVLVTGPSGVGKTTLCQALIKQLDFRLAISATTRPPRSGEVNGRDYHFLNDQDFEKHVQAGDFVEHALVYQHRYGTLRQPVQEALAEGQRLVMSKDVQGVPPIKKAFPKSLTVFIAPPSLESLGERLRKRGENSPEDFETRLAEAAREIERQDECDLTLVNENLEQAEQELCHTVEGYLKGERP